MSQTTEYQGTALITGASTGIGAIYAKRLAARGYDLILVARNQQRLDDVAASIRQQTGREVQVLVADLTNNADLQKVETVLKDDTSITLLVNNAGFGGAGPLLNSDINKMQEMITLNISALTQLTYAAAPAFVARLACQPCLRRTGHLPDADPPFDHLGSGGAFEWRWRGTRECI